MNTHYEKRATEGVKKINRIYRPLAVSIILTLLCFKKLNRVRTPVSLVEEMFRVILDRIW